MTAPTLPDTLRRLHTALQSGGGRIRVEKRRDFALGQTETLWVVLGGRVQRAALLTPERHADLNDPFHLLMVEAVLREECEARGWTWGVEALDDGRAFACVFLQDRAVHPGLGSYANTPAHAHALALLAALSDSET